MLHPYAVCPRRASLIQKSRRHTRRGLNELLAGLYEPHHDRQGSFEGKLALHDSGDRPKLLANPPLPLTVVPRDDERRLLGFALGDDLRFAAGTAVQIEPDAHRLGDPDLRLAVHHEGDGAVGPLGGRDAVALARVDGRPVRLHPLTRREGNGHLRPLPVAAAPPPRTPGTAHPRRRPPDATARRASTARRPVARRPRSHRRAPRPWRAATARGRGSPDGGGCSRWSPGWRWCDAGGSRPRPAGRGATACRRDRSRPLARSPDPGRASRRARR